MPRRARIDTAGAVQQVTCRGVERCRIFRDDSHGQDFISRLGRIPGETRTPPVKVRALMPNHCHLSIRTGGVPAAMVMKGNYQ
jgi:hypothetical protein